MSKVFTIAEGLENLGALKTGGQGSIYRAKRIGPIITAVKLLPTPILNEDETDKHYRDFRNEVEKLKRVNETPNPNVVRILNFGISETGSFPFIEMEFIEGPDLEDLLKAPNDDIFTVKETIKVAEHLAHALAHCHRVEVKHGDIKSNNIKYNIHTGNYVLLDFGLALMSDEQRRTSLRHAGAIEFMAPEQNEGHMMFQTDIYSFGVIMYELLAGRVPFPLDHKSETARNHVLVAHLETPPPDILPLRAEHVPANWPQQRRDHEMQVPQWLLDMIRKCLEKKPEDRFSNGIELYEHILRHSIATVSETSELTAMLRDENRKLKEENERLRKQSRTAETAPAFVPPPPPIATRPQAPVEPIAAAAYTPTATAEPRRKNILLPVIAVLAVILIAVFFLLKSNNKSQSRLGASTTTDTSTVSNSYDLGNDDATMVPPEDESEKQPVKPDTIRIREEQPQQPVQPTTAETQPQQPAPQEPPAQAEQNDEDPTPTPGRVYVNRRYTVASSRAYFHNEPDGDTRRNAYLTPSDEVMTATAEEGDYVYITFTNPEGQTSKGWVRKRDLSPAQ